MGEAVIREAVAIVEEVEELDAHAGMLEDLAGTVAATDPELAEQIVAAAEALESRADELADEADIRFEQAQELADEALLDEVTGELESDVEDIVAGIETTPFVALEEASVESQADDDVVAEVVRARGRRGRGRPGGRDVRGRRWRMGARCRSGGRDRRRRDRRHGRDPRRYLGRW